MSRAQRFVKANWEYVANEPGELSFDEGAIITLLNDEDKDGWWQGELKGAVRIFPSNFVEEYKPPRRKFY